jgi:hypothetical protein
VDDGLTDLGGGLLPAAVLVLFPGEGGEDGVRLSSGHRAGKPLPGKSRDDAQWHLREHLLSHGDRRRKFESNLKVVNFLTLEGW